MNKGSDLFSVEGRLKTFKKYPKIKGAPLCNPLYFAQAGFYDISTRRIRDLVRCFACGKELDCWEPGDDPWQEHVKRGKDCPLVLYRSKDPPTLEDYLDLHLKVRTLEIESEAEKLKTTVRKEFEPIIEM